MLHVGLLFNQTNNYCRQFSMGGALGVMHSLDLRDNLYQENQAIITVICFGTPPYLSMQNKPLGDFHIAPDNVRVIHVNNDADKVPKLNWPMFRLYPNFGILGATVDSNWDSYVLATDGFKGLVSFGNLFLGSGHDIALYAQLLLSFETWKALEIEHWLSGKEDKELIQALKELSKWSDKKIFHDAKHAGHGRYGRIVGSNQRSVDAQLDVKYFLDGATFHSVPIDESL